MQCQSCGQVNDAGLRYCVACGDSLIAEPDGDGASTGGSSDSLLPPGTVLKSTYETIRLLGEGGAGAVYEARHVDLGHAVAVKVLFGQLARIKQIRSRFVEEGRIQANLRHPNIVRVSDIVDDGHIVAIVMEFVEGETLHDFIQRQREPVPVMRAAQIMIKLLAGLGAAHDREIVHRDIKPGNVMLAQTDRGIVPKLCDFGIAKVASSQSRTVTGTKMGTLHYMAPEQFQDAARVDRRADIYSMGITFFELLTRRLPFETDNDYQLMRAHIELQPPSPIGMRPDLSLALSSLLLKALEKRPKDRFQSCQDMTDALTGLPGFESLRGVASLPGVPVTDDLIPPPARAIRRTQARIATRGPSPNRASAPTRDPSQPRPRDVASSPFERSRGSATSASQRPSEPAESPRKSSKAPRRIAWFPIFLGAFAAILIGVVAVFVITRQQAGPSTAAAAPSDPLGDPKTDRDADPSARAAVADPASDGADAASQPPVADVIWTVDSCEALAEAMSDLESLHDLDEQGISDLAGRLDDAEERCRDRLMPSGSQDEYLLRYGQTQLDRLRIARFVLLARRAGDDRDAACRHIMVAEQAADNAASRLRRTAENPDLHASLRESIGELGQSVLDGQSVLQTRYLDCWRDDLSRGRTP